MKQMHVGLPKLTLSVRFLPHSEAIYPPIALSLSSSSRMPGTARDVSAVGRFPGVTLSNGDAAPEKEKVMIEKGAEEGGCHRWLRRICPCCCRQKSSSYDITPGTGTAGNAVDGKEEEKPAPLPEPAKPQTGDQELDRTVCLIHTPLHSCVWLK